MRRILVTGTGSFIGEAFQRRASLFSDRYQVECLSLRGDTWRAADFSRYDAVVHVAGLAHVKYNDAMRDAYMAVNRDLAIEAAKKARADGAGHFLFLSSMIVYGAAARAGKTRVITANTPPAPENAYGESKLLAEAGIRALADEQFRVAILRIPTVYGKNCRGNYRTLSIWAEKLPFFPDIAGARSVIYAENLAEFIRLLIDNRASGTFFPQNADYASATDFLRAIAAARGIRVPMTKIFNPAVRLLGGSGFLRKALGGLVYDRALSQYPTDYNIVGFTESIRRTEE